MAQELPQIDKRYLLIGGIVALFLPSRLKVVLAALVVGYILYRYTGLTPLDFVNWIINQVREVGGILRW